MLKKVSGRDLRHQERKAERAVCLKLGNQTIYINYTQRLGPIVGAKIDIQTHHGLNEGS